MIRTFSGITPVVDKTAFIHDSAEIIGRVRVGREASVWPMAVLRGDVAQVVIGERANIQDHAVVHGREGRPAVVGRGVSVGHGAIIHGARIGDLCLIGMGAVVMESVIGRECLVAAGAMVPKGLKIAPRSLVMGIPAKAVRCLTRAELRHLRQSEKSYLRLARLHRLTSRVVF